MAENGNGHAQPDPQQQLAVLQRAFVSLEGLADRLQLGGRLGYSYNGLRNIYDALGWPQTLSYYDYYNFYSRSDIAGRIVDLPVDACWREGFEIDDEADKPDHETPFAKAWVELDKRLRLTSWLTRLDRLSGIGQYAVLFLGVRGQDPAQPLAKVAENALAYASVFTEPNAVIDRLDTDPQSERFGLPDQYSLTTADLAGLASSGGGVRQVRQGRAAQVHWSRCIHAAEALEDTKVFGRPRLQRVYNLLSSLQLVVGGSGEAFWRSARPRYHANIGKDAQGYISPEELEGLGDQLAKMIHGFQDWLRTSYTDVQQLAATPADPSGHVSVILDLVSAATGIPKRILLGSERGELASSQDAQEWAHRVAERQINYVEPTLVRPLIDRLIEAGALPEPSGGEYEVVWPDLTGPSADQRATLADRVASAEAKHAQAEMLGKPSITRNELRELLGLDAIDAMEEEVPGETPPLPSAPEKPAPVLPGQPGQATKPGQVPPPGAKPAAQPAKAAAGLRVEASPPFDFASTQLDLSGADAAAILAVKLPANCARETNPHITVRYGVEQDEPGAALAKALAKVGPVTARIDGYRVFQPDHEAGDVPVLTVSSPALAELRALVERYCECAPPTYDYAPHVTLGTCDGALAVPLDVMGLIGRELSFDTLTFGARDGTVTTLPLVNPAKAAAGWDESKHPRVPGGSGDPSGEWTSGDVSGGDQPIAVYHGTQAGFEGDFSTDKIGAGEGGTAQGAGINLTSSIKTAKGYAKGGPVYKVEILARPEELLNFDVPFNEQSGYVQERLNKLSIFGEAPAIKKINETTFEAGSASRGQSRPYRLVDEGHRGWTLQIPAGDDYLPGKSFSTEAAGKKALQDLTGYVGNQSGRKIYESLGWPRHASRRLNDVGIHGATYEAGQAGLTDPFATNYTIFDPSKVRITSRDARKRQEAQSGGPFVGADADADLRVNALFATIMAAVNAATDAIFGAATMDAIRAALIDFGQRMVARFGRPEQEFDPATQSAVEYLRTYGASRIAGIGDTTRELLRDTLTEGLRNGETQAQLAARVRVYFRGVSAGRAKVIALTEAHNATQLGAFSALVQAGVTAKAWRTQQDERVRPEHAALDGQIRHIGDPFEVPGTGEQTMRPGNFGIARLDVGCRCWLEAAGNMPPEGLSANAGDGEWPRRLAVHERRVLAAVRRGLRAQEAAVLAVLAGGPTVQTWDESKHPRDPGGEGGGQWVDSGGAALYRSKMTNKEIGDYIAQHGEQAFFDLPLSEGAAKKREPVSYTKLLDAAVPAELAHLREVYGDPAVYKKLYKGQTGYVPSQKAIYGITSTKYNPDEMNVVLAHEWGHHIDYQIGGGSASWSESVMSTMKDEGLRATAQKSVWDHHLENLSQTNMLPKKQRAFADYLGALTGGKVGYGHDFDVYNDPYSRGHEMFANAVALRSDRVLSGLMRQAAPNWYKEFDGALARGSKVRSK